MEKQSRRPTTSGDMASGWHSPEIRSILLAPGRARRFKKLVWLAALPIALIVFAAFGLHLAAKYKWAQAFVHDRFTTALKESLGEKHQITLGRTELSLHDFPSISLVSEAVEIQSNNSSKIKLDEITLGLNAFDFLRGTSRIERVSISGGVIELKSLQGQAKLPAAGKFSQLRSVLHAIGALLEQAKNTFDKSGMARIDAHRLRLVHQSEPFGVLVTGRLKNHDQGPLNFSGEVSLPDINGDFNVTYKPGKDSRNRLIANLSVNPSSPIWQRLTGSANARGTFEILAKADLPIENTAAADSQNAMPFAAKTQNLTIKARLEPDNGAHISGRAVVAMRVLPDENRIAIDELTVDSHADGAFDTQLQASGTLLSADLQKGFLGDLAFDLSINDGRITILQGKTNIEPAFKGLRAIRGALVGKIMHSQSRMVFDRIALNDERARLNGSADLRFFTDATQKSTTLLDRLALKADFEGGALDFSLLSALWPIFIAPKTRNWANEHIHAGRLDKWQTKLDFGPGRMVQLLNKEPILPGEIMFGGDFSETRFTPLRKMPEVSDAKGNLRLEQSRFSAKLDSGSMIASKQAAIHLKKSHFMIDDIISKPAIGMVKIDAAGPLSTMLEIARSGPFKVAEKVPIDPTGLKGKGEAHIRADFELLPIEKQSRKPRWQAVIRTDKASSTKKIFGRNIDRADLKITSNNAGVEIEGDANIDGITTSVAIKEPVKGRAVRNFKGVITTDELAQRGINLSPVISGKLKIKIAGGNGKTERYHVDLKDAELTLPWIGWRKGAGIPAAAEFILSRDGKFTRLDNFSVNGTSFKAKGKLAFLNSLQLASADLSHVSLLGSDNFAVTVQHFARRVGGAVYEVKASGKRFDLRSTLRMLLGGGNEKWQKRGQRLDLRLTANFDQVAGFGGQVINNAHLSYREDAGLEPQLEANGHFGKDQTLRLSGVTQNNVIRYELHSENAGALAKFVDVYDKMEGGSVSASFTQAPEKSLRGDIAITKFDVIGEERLRALTAAPAKNNSLERASGAIKKLYQNRIRFESLTANLVRSGSTLEIIDGRTKNAQIGLTFEGTLYDTNGQMNIRGTFMPLFVISRVLGIIPLVGDVFSNGRDSGLIGITYQLKGPAAKPRFIVNPISLIAPGVFNKAFEFKE